MASHLQLSLPRPNAQAITMLRTGCNMLPVSVGRLNSPPVDLNRRYCGLCPNTVGNEEHFLLYCNAGDPQLRTEILQQAAYQHCARDDPNATANCPNTTDLIRRMLNPLDKDIAIKLGKYVKTGLAKLKEKHDEEP